MGTTSFSTGARLVHYSLALVFGCASTFAFLADRQGKRARTCDAWLAATDENLAGRSACEAQCENDDTGKRCGEMGDGLLRRRLPDEPIGASDGVARKAYERGCAKGDLRACSSVKFLDALTGTPVADVFGKGTTGFDRACGNREVRRCHQAAAHYFHNADSSREVALYQQGCERADSSVPMIGCVVLGELLLADAAPKNEPVAVRLFEKCCDAKSPAGCGALANAHRAGAVVPKDERKATTLSQRACSGGLTSACEAPGVRAPSLSHTALSRNVLDADPPDARLARDILCERLAFDRYSAENVDLLTRACQKLGDTECLEALAE